MKPYINISRIFECSLHRSFYTLVLAVYSRIAYFLPIGSLNRKPLNLASPKCSGLFCLGYLHTGLRAEMNLTHPHLLHDAIPLDEQKCPGAGPSNGIPQAPATQKEVRCSSYFIRRRNCNLHQEIIKALNEYNLKHGGVFSPIRLRKLTRRNGGKEDKHFLYPLLILKSSLRNVFGSLVNNINPPTTQAVRKHLWCSPGGMSGLKK